MTGTLPHPQTNPAMKNIATAIVKAQRQFGPALKTSTNPAFKSRYADLAACIEAVIDALNANGIALIQQTHDDSTGVTVETVFIHESGEQISSGRLHVPASKNDPQGYGSALTYARRYSLMAACGIAPEDDDANLASRKPAAPPPPAANRHRIGDSVAVINSAKDVGSLRAFWKVEVTKFDPKGVEYETLKDAAAARQAYLQEMAVHE